MTPRDPQKRPQQDDWDWNAFEGWSLQRYTQVPNLYFCQIMHRLSLAENAVLMYIFFKTFGWQKERDAISLTQIVNGTVNRKTGRKLDHGTGLARSTVVVALKGLQDKKLIIADKQIGPDGVNAINVYEPRFRQDDLDAERGVVRESNYGYPRIGRGGSPILEPGVVRESDPHVEQYTQEQQQPEPPSSSSPPVNLKASTARRGVVVASPLQVKKTKRAEETRPEHLPEDQALLRDLVAAGVSRHVAHQLVRKYPKPDIEIQLSALRFRNATEPAAILVQAIKESWAMPRAFEEAKRKEAQEAQCRAEREATERVRIAEERARQEREERTNACIEAMNVDERLALERTAATQIRGEGPVWRDREIPRAVLNATMRSIVAERLGLAEGGGSVGGRERV